MQTVLDTIMEELEQPTSPLICAGKETTSSCFTLHHVKCHKTEDYLGADDCLLKVYADNALKKTLKKRMNDGQLWRVGLNFPFDEKIFVKLWDEDLLDPDDLIGTITLGSTSTSGTKHFKSGRAYYSIIYSVKHSRPTTPIPLPLQPPEPREVVRQALENLPNDWDTFLEIVNEIAKKEVNLPSIFISFWSKNPEYKRKIEYKPIDRFAQANFFGHLRKIRESMGKSKGGNPPWLKDLLTQISQPGAKKIDWHLALAIALREGGQRMYSSKNTLLSTARRAGIDNAYSIRYRLVRERLIPREWAKSMKQDPHPRWPRAAMVPKSRFLALTFATVGRVQNRLSEEVKKIIFGKISDHDKRSKAVGHLIENLTPLARRIWIGVSFGGIGYLQSMLGHFRELSLPLGAITDIPNAVKSIMPNTEGQKNAKSRLLRFIDIKRSKKLNVSTKTAIVAEAYQRSSETRIQTDIRTAPFLFAQ